MFSERNQDYTFGKDGEIHGESNVWSIAHR